MILRELEKKDLKEINLMRNNKELIDNLGAIFRYINMEVDERWYDNYMQQRNTTVRCSILTDDDEFVGLITLSDLDYINRKAELHIMIKNEQQGKGMGTEAVKMMLKHAFYNLNLNKVTLRALETNKRAIHVYEKNGFVVEGVSRQDCFKNGQLLNMVNMSILKNEFERKNNG